MNRTTIRSILLGIIGLIMLCYVCGIVVWLLPSDSLLSGATNTPAVRPSNTPIDPFDLPTREPSATSTSSGPPTSTPDFVPVVPTSQIFATFTPLPTFTLAATNTPLPTNTSPPTPVPIPSDTPMIILPPTDTPSP